MSAHSQAELIADDFWIAFTEWKKTLKDKFDTEEDGRLVWGFVCISITRRISKSASLVMKQANNRDEKIRKQQRGT